MLFICCERCKEQWSFQFLYKPISIYRHLISFEWYSITKENRKVTVSRNSQKVKLKRKQTISLVQKMFLHRVETTVPKIPIPIWRFQKFHFIFPKIPSTCPNNSTNGFPLVLHKIIYICHYHYYWCYIISNSDLSAKYSQKLRKKTNLLYHLLNKEENFNITASSKRRLWIGMDFFFCIIMDCKL